MDVGLVRQVDIDQEMQQSYLDYAMSTIVARALPDARDGLKPVQRRILYGMYDMGLRIDSSYKKSARIVGEVLGKYHPHGDQAVYEAMARLAQDFSMRYTLVDGQGNFGSVDGDPPAAMRYTEARLASTALELLNQLDRNTVDFVRNFDDSLNEPVVLPAAIPNLLVNGASGIAVGMATSIPPHNLTEVTDALLFMLENWEKLDDTSVSDLMKFIKGPDFPTGGIILQESESDEMLSAYATGRGKVILRGKVHLEEMGRGKSRIIITELPYQTNKSALVERIAELAREGNIDGISDLRDESDRQGMRIVIELNKAAEESNILRELYRRTPLQTTFRISLLALVDGQPRLLALKQALRVYLEHRIDVIRKRTQFDLDKARQRAHILEGLRVALNNLDEVIQIIRRAQDVEEARTKLIKRFKLSEIQASAILEMQLRRLAALERKKIETEYKDLLALIKELEGLLKSAKKLRQVVGDELLQINQTYGDKRRTQIVSLKAGTEARDLLTTNDLTPAQTVWVGLTEEGLIGRTTGDKLPRVSGRQAPILVYKTNTHHTLYLVDKEGRTAAIAVQSLPETESFIDGIPVNKAAPFPSDPKIKKIFSLPARFEEGAEWTVISVTQSGMIKKSSVIDLPGPSSQLFTLVKVNEGDAVQSVFLVNGKSDCVLVTRKGMTIRFSENDVRVMGLVAAGVNGIKLSAGDEVITAFRYDEQMEMLLVAANGKAWRIPDSQLPLQGRYGQGTTTCKVGTTEIVGVLHGFSETEGLAHLGQLATKPIVINQISSGKRQSAPKVLIQPKPGDYLAAITALEDGLMDWEPKKRRIERKPGGSPSSKMLDIDDEKDQPVTGIRKKIVSKKSGTEQISVDKVEQPALFPEESKRGRKPKTVKPSEQIAATKVKSQVRSSSRGTSPKAGKAASEALKAKTKPGFTSQSTAKDPNPQLKQRGRPKGSGTKTSAQAAKPKSSTNPKPISKRPGRKPRPKSAEEK